jgi:hypothetical protein
MVTFSAAGFIETVLDKAIAVSKDKLQYNKIRVNKMWYSRHFYAARFMISELANARSARVSATEDAALYKYKKNSQSSSR